MRYFFWLLLVSPFWYVAPSIFTSTLSGCFLPTEEMSKVQKHNLIFDLLFKSENQVSVSIHFPTEMCCFTLVCNIMLPIKYNHNVAKCEHVLSDYEYFVDALFTWVNMQIVDQKNLSWWICFSSGCLSGWSRPPASHWIWCWDANCNPTLQGSFISVALRLLFSFYSRCYSYYYLVYLY